MALAAIGLETRWASLKEVGVRAMLAALVGAALLSTIVGLIVMGA